jgi:CheY-like chemotaxis protein
LEARGVSLLGAARFLQIATKPMLLRAGGRQGGNPVSTTLEYQQYRILIVDDDPVVGRAMEVLLSREGFHTAVCQTGSEAMSIVNDQQFVAAIVDIHLPDMNGLALSQHLRISMGPVRPIVILSGDNSMETIRSLPQTGATYFFSKPVNAVRLIEQLKEWTRPIIDGERGQMGNPHL